MNVYKTLVECFEYAVTPRRRPLHYHQGYHTVLISKIYSYCGVPRLIKYYCPYF